jgi:hypothetical protein
MNDKKDKKDKPLVIAMVGAIVHYVTEDGVHLPALVVKDWGYGMLNLSVFIDHSQYTGDPIFPVTSVPYSDEFAPNSWHLPEPVELPKRPKKEEGS